MKTSTRIALLALLVTVSAGCGRIDDSSPDASDAADASALDSEGDSPSDGTVGDSPIDVEDESLCAAPTVPCDGVCMDVSADQKNCGACGAVCDGQCRLGHCITVLASGQDLPTGLGVDATSVYWTTRYSLATKCAKNGCNQNPTVLVATDVSNKPSLAVDGTNVLVTYQPAGFVATCAVGGCGGTASYLAGPGFGAPFFIVVDATNAYWTSGGPAPAVFKCALSGCNGAPTTIASGLQFPEMIAVDATTVYWTDRVKAQIFKCPVGGCAGSPTVFASANGPSGIAVDATSVYWLDGYVGNVSKCPKVGCIAPTTLATQQQSGLVGVAVDATNVYWTDSNTGRVLKCAIGGCGGQPTIIAEKQFGTRNLVIDATSIYWVTADSVLKATPK